MEEKKEALEASSLLEVPGAHGEQAESEISSSVNEGRRGEKRKKGIIDTYTTDRLLTAIKAKIHKKISQNIQDFL